MIWAKLFFKNSFIGFIKYETYKLCNYDNISNNNLLLSANKIIIIMSTQNYTDTQN